ncbi:MAG: three-Cys-motif partner protein TcmP, partial [Niallia sp.]
MHTDFFTEQQTQSFIKTEILRKYFDVWSNIMVTRNKVAKLNYIDLFSGPGVYEDGSPSTPMQIVQHCIEKPKLHEKIVFLFNDKSKESIDLLSNNLFSIQGIENLKNRPQLLESEVDETFTDTFQKIKLAPTFSFVDPFGYKGVTRDLIFSLVKDFGSDCVLFFNFNRVRMGITNRLVDRHMKNIFGEERHEYMKQVIPDMDKDLKEAFIIEMLSQSFSDNGKHLILPFKFVSEKKYQTSHYIILISKSPLGYQIMKDIMAKESTLHEEGIAGFSYIPVKHLKKHHSVQLSILENYEESEMGKLKQRILNVIKDGPLKMLE